MYNRGMSDTAPSNDHRPEILIGLRRIGAAVGRSDQTAKRWIRDFGLPAWKLKTGAYALSLEALHEWHRNQREQP